MTADLRFISRQEWGRIILILRCINSAVCVKCRESEDDLMKYNEMDGPVFKIKGDPRITKVGKFIRKYSIDETSTAFKYC